MFVDKMSYLHVFVNLSYTVVLSTPTQQNPIPILPYPRYTFRGPIAADPPTLPYYCTGHELLLLPPAIQELGPFASPLLIGSAYEQGNDTRV